MTTTDPYSFLGCGDKRYAKGLRLAHYRQHRRGEPLAPVARRTAAEAARWTAATGPTAPEACAPRTTPNSNADRSYAHWK